MKRKPLFAALGVRICCYTAAANGAQRLQRNSTTTKHCAGLDAAPPLRFCSAVYLSSVAVWIVVTCGKAARLRRAVGKLQQTAYGCRRVNHS